MQMCKYANVQMNLLPLQLCVKLNHKVHKGETRNTKEFDDLKIWRCADAPSPADAIFTFPSLREFEP